MYTQKAAEVFLFIKRSTFPVSPPIFSQEYSIKFANMNKTTQDSCLRICTFLLPSDIIRLFMSNKQMMLQENAIFFSKTCLTANLSSFNHDRSTQYLLGNLFVKDTRIYYEVPLSLIESCIKFSVRMFL